MGFYIRKSKRIGPFRLNFSKHGVGVSVGVKGLRLSKRPGRGATVYAGRKGVYYRQTVGRKRSSSRTQAKPEQGGIGCVAGCVIVLAVLFFGAIAAGVLGYLLG